MNKTLKLKTTPPELEDKKRYCSHCGTLCIKQLLGAETNQIMYGIDCGTLPADTPYDKKTGKRNYCYKYICPNYKQKRWFEIWSPHDNYFVDEVIKL